MNTFAVLIAAMVVAGEPKHHAATHSAGTHTDQKAMQHAQEQERKQYEQAMHRQAEAEKQMERAEQRSVHEQMKAQIEAYQHPLGTQITRPHASGYAGRPYNTYGGSSHRGYHHRSNRYRNHRTWPMGQDPELAALNALKLSLDHVPHGQSVAPGARLAIEHALMRVVEVARPPSVASIDRLAGHLTTALAERAAPQIDTRSLALALRGGLNAPYLINAERTAVIVELETALHHGQVPPNQVTAVVNALKNVEHQEIARR